MTASVSHATCTQSHHEEPYDVAWRRLRWRTIFMFVAFVIWIPGVFLTYVAVGIISPELKDNPKALEAITVVWWDLVAIILSISASFRASFKCARCGNPFFGNPLPSKSLGSVVARFYQGHRKCPWCGLSKGAHGPETGTVHGEPGVTRIQNYGDSALN